MGYTLRIGNAVAQPLDKDRDRLETRYVVEAVRHDCAPAFGEPTDYTNARWPSYTAWADTAREAGLQELMLEYLVKPHPGCVRLRQEHLDEIQETLRKPTLTEWTRNRLVWCEYWIRWALENCALPAMENS